MVKYAPYIGLAARFLIAQMYIIPGVIMISGFASTQALMEQHGVPGVLLYPTIPFLIGSGLCVLLGWQTRLVAAVLAIWTVLAAALFHNDFSDPNDFFNFLKNLAIAGGFLLLVKHGAGELSLDKR
jgi:putative oxidoreductase